MYKFDPNASENQQREVVTAWYKEQSDKIHRLIQATAKKWNLKNVPSIEEDFQNYANEHVFGECLPSVDEMIFGHSAQTDIHELPEIKTDFIQEVIDECLTFRRWKSLFVDYIYNIISSKLENYSQDEIHQVLIALWENNPKEALSLTGESAQNIVLSIKNELTSASEKVLETEKEEIHSYVESLIRDFLSDLGITDKTLTNATGESTTSLMSMLVPSLESNFEFVKKAEHLSVNEFLNLPETQKMFDKIFDATIEALTETLPLCVTDKLSAELDDSQKYLYIRQHMQQMYSHFDYMVCYLQNEIDLDNFIANVFPEL